MRLPEKYENQNALENMKDYTSCYIIPRAMRVDQKGDCYLNEAYDGKTAPGGTVQLKITKVPEGYIAHIDEMEKKYTWEKTDEPQMGGDLSKSYGKVVAISIEEYCKEYKVSPKKFSSQLGNKKISKNITKDIIKDLDGNMPQN